MSDDEVEEPETPKCKILSFEEANFKRKEKESDYVNEVLSCYAHSRYLLNHLEDDEIRGYSLQLLKEAFLPIFDPLSEIDKQVDSQFEEDELDDDED